MSPLSMFLTAFIVGFSGAITPGPLLLVTISQTLRLGLIAAIMIVAGHSLLELFTVVGLTFGLKEVMDKPFIFKMIGITGGMVMIWMAVWMIKDAFRHTRPSIGSLLEKAQPGRGKEGGKFLKPFGLGVIVSLSNPFWTIWWLTVGATFVSKAIKGSFILLPSFYIGHISSDLAWYGAVGISLTLGGRFINDKVYRLFLMFCSMFLFLFGAYFVYTAAKGGFLLNAISRKV
ncbi:LysE family transporter [Candidatus Poribacteria bacterium]|nr:LysE family transporter [Candidatus Poribacteria bacterium]